MAQQTINVGTSPNDGAGTPLRTAFQYTNSNFSELYTAVGPSGNNIVVPGSATITGDLTVDTSTLKVDSANNRVGIGTASPTEALEVSNGGNIKIGGFDQGIIGAGGGGAKMQFSNGASDLDLFGGSTGRVRLYTASTERYRIASDGVATWSNVGGVAGTAMTLNATGLGVGGSVTTFGYNKGLTLVDPTSAALGIISGANGFYVGLTSSGGPAINVTNNQSLSIVTGGSTSMVVNSSGNVGIGVTPSAWATLRGLQNGRANLVGYVSNSEGAWLTNNAFYDGSWKYQTSAQASHYQQLSGVHSWSIAATGTAGNAITFTQAMTLDASGNLLVGKSVSLFSTVGVEASGTGFISATNSASTNATTNLSVYSTGAAAFRFYVGLGGTVFATNTTISAISDARLKENVQDLDVGLGAILALKPRKFDWKAGKGKDIKGDRGFIAQEFEQVFPQLVDEWKDAAPEGEAPYKSVRQDLIPVLVKAIQELTARVQTLETR